MSSETKPFSISRTVNAPRELVWKVWTEKDELMKWFGPKGTTMPTADMDLRAGGHFHYCLKTPDGGEMWGKWVFRDVLPPEKITLIHSFSDASGGVTHHPMAPTWPLTMISTTTFTEGNGKTVIKIEWAPFNASEEEIATFDAGREGMTGGWTGTFEQLGEYLATLTQ